MAKPHGLAIAIMSKKKPDVESDDGQGLKDCAKDILDAIESKDASALSDALEAFAEVAGYACSDDGKEEDE